MNMKSTHSNPPSRLLLALLASTLLSGFGPLRPTTLPPGSLGFADATVAFGSGVTALTSNPAGMAQRRENNVEVAIDRDLGRQGTSVLAAMIDSTSSSGLTAGVAYGYDNGSQVGAIKREGSNLRLGAAAGAGGPAGMVFIGGAMNRLKISHDDGKRREINGWTGDLGVVVALAGALRLGFSYRNIIELDPLETPQRMAAGMAIIASPVLLSSEGSWNLQGGMATYRLGAAAMLGDTLQIRAGYIHDSAQQDQSSQQVVCAGIGARFGRTNFDLGISVPISSPGDPRIGIGLTYNMPANFQ